MRNVGFFRWELPLKSTMMLYAILSKHYELDMIFFDGDGINIEHETVTGLVLRDNEFVKSTKPIPKIINNTPYRNKNKELHKLLSNKSHFMFKPFGGKMKEYRFFKEEGTLKNILIPSTRIKNVNHVLDFLNVNKKAIFKPLYSDQGQGIFSIEKKSEKVYVFENENDHILIPINEFDEFYKNNIRKKRLLMSKFIQSRTRNGHPFDIRIDFERNHLGEWAIAQKYARIGFNNKITSNLSMGGGTSKLNKFLKAEYNLKNRKLIMNQIEEIVAVLPSIVEKMVDFDFNSIGLDLGIDNGSKVYMFEINSFPGISNALGQVALLRTGYMRYYLDKLI